MGNKWLFVLAPVVVLELFLYLYFTCLNAIRPNQSYAVYGKNRTLSAYPNVREKEVTELLNETWTSPVIYEAFTGFREKPRKGKWVNVDEAGFRYSKNQASWPPPPNTYKVFFFGGSTAFGYGVPDSETIASHLQDLLPKQKKQSVSVYNFGRGYYYSTQERILFESLLSQGFIPDLAIFLDGVNDSSSIEDIPEHTDLLTKSMRDIASPSPWRNLIDQMYISQAYHLIRNYIYPHVPLNDSQVFLHFKKPEEIKEVILRYQTNMKMISVLARGFAVKPLFIWQPSPVYQYDLRHHVFFKSLDDFGIHYRATFIYQEMEWLLTQHTFPNEFRWCADLQRNSRENLYADLLHYNASFSKVVAQCIFDQLTEKRK